jgi:nitronate monooxygenase
MAGGPSTPALVAAVCDAGGLGFLAAGYKSAAQVTAEIATTRALTSADFGVNLFVPTGPSDVSSYSSRLREEFGDRVDEPRWDDDAWDEKLALVAGVPVVSFTFGCPTRAEIARLRDAGSTVLVGITTPAEAEAAGDVDGLVVQGSEAGGHRASWADDEDPPLPLDALLAACRDDVLRWAAGGLMDADDVARVRDAGADGALLGTAFLLCPEAGTNPTLRAALVDPGFSETGLSRAYTGRTARGLANDFMRSHTDAPRGYPEIHHVTRRLRAEGDPQLAHLWAGTGWQRARAVPAAEVVRSLS